MIKSTIRLLAGAGLAALSLVAACAAPGQRPAPEIPAAPVKVAGSVVGTATSSNEAQIVIPAPVAAAWTSLGAKGAGVELVSVAGDASTTRAPVDLAADPEQATADLAEGMNGNAADVDGRSAWPDWTPSRRRPRPRSGSSPRCWTPPGRWTSTNWPSTPPLRRW